MSPLLCLIPMVWLAASPAPDFSDLAPAHAAEGPFARLMREEHFVGPGIYTASQGAAGRPEASRPSIVFPADFEESAAAILVADRLASKHPKLFVDLVAALRRDLPVVGLIARDDDRETVEAVLDEAGLADALRLVVVPTDTLWVRDYGPLFVRIAQDERLAWDFRYPKGRTADSRLLDDLAGARVADRLKEVARPVPLQLEGGNLLSDGRGLVLTTTVTYNRNIADGYEAAMVTRVLGRALGARQIVVLEPLADESTAHVDMFACLVDPTTVLVGQCAGASDPVNAARLDRNAALLAKVVTPAGPLRVIRVPMPEHDDGVWRTYLNVVFTKRQVLVPRYEGASAELRRKAIEIFQEAVPKRRIVPLDVGRLIADGGSLRCVTLFLSAAAPATPLQRDAPAGRPVEPPACRGGGDSAGFSAGGGSAGLK